MRGHEEISCSRDERGPDGRGCEACGNGKATVDFYGRMGGGVPDEEEILKRIEALL